MPCTLFWFFSLKFSLGCCLALWCSSAHAYLMILLFYYILSWKEFAVCFSGRFFGNVETPCEILVGGIKTDWFFFKFVIIILGGDSINFYYFFNKSVLKNNFKAAENKKLATGSLNMQLMSFSACSDKWQVVLSIAKPGFCLSRLGQRRLLSETVWAIRSVRSLIFCDCVSTWLGNVATLSISRSLWWQCQYSDQN